MRPALAAAGLACLLGFAAPVARGEVLSDERTETRFANAVKRALVFERRSGASRVVGSLRLRNEDGSLETYLALARRSDEAGSAWIRIRLPARPNGGTGWVRAENLGPLFLVRTMLLVDRRALRATLFRRGSPIWTSRIGVGARSTPTPAGRFWIRSRLRNLRGGVIYGPWAFGTAAYSVLSDWPGGGVIGIHGTNEPWLIPGRPSHGCIRVPNRKVRGLARLMPIGTPVRIV